MKNKRLWVVYGSVTIGAAVWSVLLASVGRLPSRLVVPVAVFTAITVNAVVWISARVLTRMENAGRQAVQTRANVSPKERWFRWCGLGLGAVGISLCLLSFWTGTGSAGNGSVLIAEGVFLLVFSKTRSRKT